MSKQIAAQNALEERDGNRELVPWQRLGRPWFTRRDAAYLGYLPLLALIAAALPPLYWPPVCRGLAGFIGMRVRWNRCRDITRLAGDRLSAARAADAERALAVHRHIARLLYMRHHLRPGWRPATQLRGREHLDRALNERRGAVLWVQPLIYSDIATKVAFDTAGYRIAHLSRSSHGLSYSRIGVPMFNWLWSKVEERYLETRLVMRPENSAGALRGIAKRLRAGGIVSITVGNWAQKEEQAPFMDGTVPLSTAPIALARRSKADLLPVFSVWLQGEQVFETVIAPPIDPSVDISAALADYAQLLEQVVLKHPDQYVRWSLYREPKHT